MEVYEIIQYCEISEGSGTYNRERFIKAVTELPGEKFNYFLREYLHLLEFYHSTVNFYVTDDMDFIKKHPKYLEKNESINFDTPINFVRRK